MLACLLNSILIISSNVKGNEEHWTMKLLHKQWANSLHSHHQILPAVNTSLSGTSTYESHCVTAAAVYGIAAAQCILTWSKDIYYTTIRRSIYTAI